LHHLRTTPSTNFPLLPLLPPLSSPLSFST
jgi:hypothetical protein